MEVKVGDKICFKQKDGTAVKAVIGLINDDDIHVFLSETMQQDIISKSDIIDEIAIINEIRNNIELIVAKINELPMNISRKMFVAKMKESNMYLGLDLNALITGEEMTNGRDNKWNKKP